LINQKSKIFNKSTHLNQALEEESKLNALKKMKNQKLNMD
jgi:hypothetical protein